MIRVEIKEITTDSQGGLIENEIVRVDYEYEELDFDITGLPQTVASAFRTYQKQKTSKEAFLSLSPQEIRGVLSDMFKAYHSGNITRPRLFDDLKSFIGEG